MKYTILLLLISTNLLSLELKGKIIHISDGDTVHLLTDNKEKIKIRLNNIDAPESKQAFGNKSKENLKNYELVEALANMDENPLFIPKVVNLLLGKEQAERLKDHVRVDGTIPTDKMMAEIENIFALQEVKNS